jgi:uncharacterized protein
MEVKVQKLDRKALERRGVFGWPVWEKETSRFDWHYDSIEECYFLDGAVTVKTKDGESVKLGKGDFVTFPKGLSCTWEITHPVRKHYNFR